MNSIGDKIQAIVLGTVQLNDHAQLVHFYTELYGRVTCRIPLATRGKQAARLRSMMSPMTLLEVVLSGRPNESIHTLAEASIVQSPYMLAAARPEKAAQCIFMAELFSRTIREEERNERLWNFLTGSLMVLENCEEGAECFHLVFTCGMIAQLGFGVDTERYAPGCCFDMREAQFTEQCITHPYYFNPESAKWFRCILDCRYDDIHRLKLSGRQRAALLDMLLAYLTLQMPEMGQVRSVEVLKSLSTD